MGWLPSVVLAVVGIVPLLVVLPRVLAALRRARVAEGALRTSVTGRAQRIKAGMAEVRAWRASRRAEPAGGEVSHDGGVGLDA